MQTGPLTEKFKMLSKKDFIVVGVISILLALLGFFLDINERVPDIKTNILETIIMAAILYGVISIIYIPIRLLTRNSNRQ